MTRPHYALRIVLVDPPDRFGDYVDVVPRLEIGPDSFSGAATNDGLAFTVDYDLKFLGDVWQPSGPAIRREKDGRRFVYLAWHGTRNGVRERFRRLKVHLGELDHFAEDGPLLRVVGRDAKGAPACATARFL